jgi:hypothetical protein
MSIYRACSLADFIKQSRAYKIYSLSLSGRVEISLILSSLAVSLKFLPSILSPNKLPTAVSNIASIFCCIYRKSQLDVGYTYDSEKTSQQYSRRWKFLFQLKREGYFGLLLQFFETVLKINSPERNGVKNLPWRLLSVRTYHGRDIIKGTEWSGGE